MTPPLVPLHVAPDAEALPAAGMRASERLLARVAMRMDAQARRARERLIADAADIPVLRLLVWRRRGRREVVMMLLLLLLLLRPGRCCHWHHCRCWWDGGGGGGGLLWLCGLVEVHGTGCGGFDGGCVGSCAQRGGCVRW